jgi:hypothetical protein
MPKIILLLPHGPDPFIVPYHNIFPEVHFNDTLFSIAFQETVCAVDGFPV